MHKQPRHTAFSPPRNEKPSVFSLQCKSVGRLQRARHPLAPMCIYRGKPLSTMPSCALLCFLDDSGEPLTTPFSAFASLRLLRVVFLQNNLVLRAVAAYSAPFWQPRLGWARLGPACRARFLISAVFRCSACICTIIRCSAPCFWPRFLLFYTMIWCLLPW